MDIQQAQEDPGLVQLGAAIRAQLQGRTQAWLAAELGVDQGYLSKILNGKVDGLALEFVVRVEKALTLPPGALLVAAGYVGLVQSPEEAIEMDGRIPPLSKRVLIAAVEAARDIEAGG